VTDSGTAASLGENQLEHWRAVGGFVGVILPYHHWVDFDGSVGVSSRSYGNGDAIYGERGLSLSMTALTFRFGVSDRMSHKPAGIRLGAALAVSADLSHANPEWSRQYTLVDGSTGETTGTTHIGGVSIGLVVSAGFEVGARPVRVP
ncbi:MAG TPA: hypothetical protein VHU80_11790, partial [Polyangiaceae bacterium]|nr:hypothetical protein [Polyangiaceae bacterium]